MSLSSNGLKPRFTLSAELVAPKGGALVFMPAPNAALAAQLAPYHKGERGSMPAHTWNGTSIAFEQPLGGFGAAVDLKGATGDSEMRWTSNNW